MTCNECVDGKACGGNRKTGWTGASDGSWHRLPRGTGRAWAGSVLGVFLLGRDFGLQVGDLLLELLDAASHTGVELHAHADELGTLLGITQHVGGSATQQQTQDELFGLTVATEQARQPQALPGAVTVGLSGIGEGAIEVGVGRVGVLRETVETLPVEFLSIEALAVEALAIETLSIEALTVETLTVETLRDRKSVV